MATGCRVGGAAGPSRAVGAGSSDSVRLRAEAEYALLQAELQLAQKDKTYLIFDWSLPSANVMLKGALVARCAMKVEGDAGAVQRFRERFRDGDDRVLRGLIAKHLYTAQKQTPDSILTTVGEVLNMDPEILQRHIPGWFEFDWGDDLVLEVHADVAGQPVPGTDLRVQKLRRVLKRPFGEARLKVTMDRRDALTLYRVARSGFATLSPAF
jgi:hypothetical protein